MNCFVVSTPYHLLVSCAMSRPGDWVVVEDADCFEGAFGTLYLERFFPDRSIDVISYTSLFRAPFTARKKLRQMQNEISARLQGEVDDLLYFNDAEPVVQYMASCMDWRGKRILLEEGIGLYNDMRHRGKLRKLAMGKLVFGKWYQCINQIGEYPQTDAIACKTPEKLSSRQQAKEVRKHDYQEVARFIDVQREVSARDIWFIGQPLVEDGACSEADYLGCLRKCMAIASARDMRLTLKPHPREDMRKYECLPRLDIYAEKDMPLELLIAPEAQTVLLTVSSSAVQHFSVCKSIRIGVLYPLIHLKAKVANGVFDEKWICVAETWAQVEKLLEG